MTEQKYREVPEEISDLFDNADTCDACRDQCIKSMFRAKRAIFYGTQARKARRKAWELVYKLYPDVEGKRIQFEYGKGIRELSASPAAHGEDNSKEKA